MRRKTLVIMIIFFVSIHFETPLQYFILNVALSLISHFENEKELLIPIYSNPIPLISIEFVSRKMIFGSV